MPLLKTLWKIKRRNSKALKSLRRPKKTPEERRAEGEAAITRQESSEAVQVRCIAGQSAFTIQLIASDEFEILEEPQVASTLEDIRVLNHTTKQVTMGYLFTERTKASEQVLLTVLWAARSNSGEKREGTVNIDFQVADGGRPTLLSIESSGDA